MCDLDYNDIDPSAVESSDLIDLIEELYKNSFTGAHKSFVEHLIHLGHESLLARAFVMRTYLYGLQTTRKDGNVVKYLAKFVVPWAELHAVRPSPVSKYAQVILADCYKKGIGVKVDLERAFHLYEESAVTLYPPALNNVGICYEQGEGVTKDIAEGMKWYQRAAEQGYANAMDNLANALHDTEGVPDGDAVRWYRRAAGMGYHRSINTLAGMHMEGDCVDESDEEAVRWLKRGVELGSASSHYFLSFCYQHGRGVDVDVVESFRLLKIGADLGDEDAQLRYGAHMLYGLSVEDYERGRFFQRVYDAGYDATQCTLVQKNEEEGLSYLIDAANQRCGTACEYLAQFYFERHQDYISAYRWLRLGRHCRDNSAECMYLLGLLHFYGIVSTCCYNQDTPLTKEALRRVPAEPVDAWREFPSPPPEWYPHDPRKRLTREEELRLAKRYFLLARQGQCYRASVYLFWLQTQGDTVDLSIARAIYSSSSSTTSERCSCDEVALSASTELDPDRYDETDVVDANSAVPFDSQDLLGPPLTKDALHCADDARYFQVAYSWLQALTASSTEQTVSASSPSSSSPRRPLRLATPSLSTSPSTSSNSLFFAGTTPLSEKEIANNLRIFRDHRVGRNFYAVHHHLAVYFATPGPHQEMLQAVHHLETFQRYIETTLPDHDSDHGDGNISSSKDEWHRLQRAATQRRQGREKYERHCQQLWGRDMTEDEAWRVDHSLLTSLHSDSLPLLDGLDGEAEGLCNIGLTYYYGLFYLSSRAKSPKEVAAAAQVGEYWRMDTHGASEGMTATKTAEQRQVELHRAIICFRRSAELGNARAQFCLGWCYRWGEGTNRDRCKAVEWFHASALQGYARAQFQLGLCYLKGKGVEMSEEEGWRWITAAAMQQYEEAVKYQGQHKTHTKLLQAEKR